ncbi:hypothetical protein GPOL_c02320 [Gordonia polyisoprenivorans VH2]|uniref:Secreted protein n=1 Tax=Gordonia polyisoprenivorans (strain DSM 44266 / VH2) TaxID=1112204 RepID=H6MRG0_GORPV|nr:hypothetical protein [Gordonia polyisoprenivorans]AFA71305.1 hypothetical protein GPOL_c02320 [Gordonia polyisoprenivorans VH2]MBE7193821.1 hypothetical protein [Gordonia polyisoprenivorans]OZC33219.1 hypothetical protein CJJ17_18325 [Gordonia polyisoprenivorans]UZF56632.1 hypothetical protein LH935_01050 [Gordonia polyisoprenivorans]
MSRTRIRTAATIAAVTAAAVTGLIGAGAAHAAPAMPGGYYAGTVTSFPPGNTVWYGKSFTGSSVINNTAIGWAFPGRVYPGRSVLDNAEVVVIDYSGTPVGFVRDELTPDGRGGYWGRSINGRTTLLTFHLSRG